MKFKFKFVLFVFMLLIFNLSFVLSENCYDDLNLSRIEDGCLSLNTSFQCASSYECDTLGGYCSPCGWFEQGVSGPFCDSLGGSCEGCGDGFIQGDEQCEASIKGKYDCSQGYCRYVNVVEWVGCNKGEICSDCYCVEDKKCEDKDLDGFQVPTEQGADCGVEDCFDEREKVKSGSIQEKIYGEDVCKIECCKKVYGDNWKVFWGFSLEDCQNRGAVGTTDTERCYRAEEEGSFDDNGVNYKFSTDYSSNKKREDFMCGDYKYKDKYKACSTCINPSMAEECDSVDNNCDGEIDDIPLDDNWQCVIYGGNSGETQVKEDDLDVTLKQEIKFNPGGVNNRDAECYSSKEYYTDTMSDSYLKSASCKDGWVVSDYDTDPYTQISTYRCKKYILETCLVPGSESMIINSPASELDIDKFLEISDQDLLKKIEFKVASVLRNKCSDGVDNDGKESLLNAINMFQDVDPRFLFKDFSQGGDNDFKPINETLVLRLTDVDDPDCHDIKCNDNEHKDYCGSQCSDNNVKNKLCYCLDEDGDGACGCETKAGATPEGYLIDICDEEKSKQEGIVLSKYFGDCDDKLSDDDVQHREKKYICCEKSELNFALEYINKYRWMTQDMCHRGQTGSESQVVEDSKCKPEDRPNKRIKVLREVDEDTGNWEDLTAYHVHPFSVFAPSMCGYGTDVNCNKNTEQGYNLLFLLEYGESPFDMNPETGKELFQCSSNKKNSDWACYAGEWAGLSDDQVIIDFLGKYGRDGARIALIPVAVLSGAIPALGGVAVMANVILLVDFGSHTALRGFELGETIYYGDGSYVTTEFDGIPALMEKKQYEVWQKAGEVGVTIGVYVAINEGFYFLKAGGNFKDYGSFLKQRLSQSGSANVLNKVRSFTKRGKDWVANKITGLKQTFCKTCPAPAGPTGGGCFLAGTKVLMADGEYKNIEDIFVGEKVTAFDLEKQEPVEASVENTFVRIENEYLVIKYEVLEE